MKELSIEEKAKRYDEILARATGANLPYYTEDIMTKVREFVEYLIPELKESEGSEDERIRKALIDYHKRGLKDSPWFTQELKHQDILAWLEKQGEHANFRNKIQIGDKVTRNEDGVLVNLSQLNRVAKKDEKQGEQPKKHDVCDYCDQQGSCVSPCPMKLVEKQGEQKPAKNIVEIWKDMRLEVYQQASGNRHEPNYSDDTTKMFSLSDIDEIIVKMSEQKPADKVEPKFKIGDKVHLINGSSPNYEDDCIVISDISNNTYYGNWEGGYFAIKDQDKYELVEQKPAWSEEDENFINDIEESLLAYEIIVMDNDIELANCIKKEIDWLKSLKDRVQPLKQEWSAEDESMRTRCIGALMKCYMGELPQTVVDEVEWLKSLRPQNTWKPSDEQMRVLDLAIRCGINRGTTEETTLVSLFNDLKKLKG